MAGEDKPDYLGGALSGDIKPGDNIESRLLMQALNARHWASSQGLTQDVNQMFGATENPQTFEGGYAKGLAGAVSGTANTFLHPVETAKQVGDALHQIYNYGPGKFGAEELHKFQQNLDNPAMWGEIFGALTPTGTEGVHMPELPPPPGEFAAAGGYGTHAAQDFIEEARGDIASEMDVFHGSRHDIKSGEFDLGKMGTGEGAQVYGWGIYLSEHPEVANTYRTAGESDKFVRHDGKPVKFSFSDGIAGLEAQRALFKNGGKIAPSWEDFVKEMHELYSRTSFPFTEQAIRDHYRKTFMDALNGKDAQMKKGFRYEVHVPDEKVEKMLDWDKNLADPGQPKVLQEIAQKVYPNIDPQFYVNITGEELYRQLSSDFERQALQQLREGKKPCPPNKTEIYGQKKASEYLKAHGVPGLRYLDRQSRTLKATGGQQTRNMVLWDMEGHKITKQIAD